MVMTSSEDSLAFHDVQKIVLGIVDEHLERNGGACLLSVKTVIKTMRRRMGIEESKALVVEIDEILNDLRETRFFDNISDSARKYVNGKRVKFHGKRSRLYALRRAS